MQKYRSIWHNGQSHLIHSGKKRCRACMYLMCTDAGTVSYCKLFEHDLLRDTDYYSVRCAECINNEVKPLME